MRHVNNTDSIQEVINRAIKLRSVVRRMYGVTGALSDLQIEGTDGIYAIADRCQASLIETRETGVSAIVALIGNGDLPVSVATGMLSDLLQK